LETCWKRYFSPLDESFRPCQKRIIIHCFALQSRQIIGSKWSIQQYSKRFNFSLLIKIEIGSIIEYQYNQLRYWWHPHNLKQVQSRNQGKFVTTPHFLHAHFLGFNRYLSNKFSSLIDFRHIDNFLLFFENNKAETLLWIAFLSMEEFCVQHERTIYSFCCLKSLTNQTRYNKLRSAMVFIVLLIVLFRLYWIDSFWTITTKNLAIAYNPYAVVCVLIHWSLDISLRPILLHCKCFCFCQSNNNVSEWHDSYQQIRNSNNYSWNYASSIGIQQQRQTCWFCPANT
jgi:hypothetical protein